MMLKLGRLVALFISSLPGAGVAQGASPAVQFETNHLSVTGAPGWVTESRVDRVTEKVQRALEWDIRKVRVRFYSDRAEFARAHGLGAKDAMVLAASKKTENIILIGPDLDAQNFDGTFGHELAHIIMYQKYKDAIPKWLEEGLANYVSKKTSIDYRWLAAQPQVSDVRSLGHPFGGGSSVKYHYAASTALMDFIASKCRVSDLLQLSVGEKLESYLGTFCGIVDLNGEFKNFVKRKSDSWR